MKMNDLLVVLEQVRKHQVRRSTDEFEVRWPKIDDFTVEEGERSIYEYLSTFDVVEDWHFCIDFLIGRSDEVSDFYIYEVHPLYLS